MRMTTQAYLPWGLLLLWSATLAGAAEVPQFNRDVRPILSENCFACHGLDGKHREAGLRLDTAEGALAERDGTAAIRPGDLANSTAWQRILSSDPDVVMPPPKSHKTLTDAQKDVIRRWIESGAAYQNHWAFEPIAAPAPALPTGAGLIDHWINQAAQAKGLPLQPEADAATLVRRVALTLTGLPPTVAEVEAFLADGSSDAYSRMVDRYLASPRFGEEMARHWLDVARYADTHGLHLDNEREMWAYRDWVIRAFNQNLPFDRFTIDQLAGDLLPEATQDQLIATGFNRCNVTTSEGGAINDEFLYRYAVDRTSTMVEAWMGLTGGCAVCHDHKYDPLSAKEFYSLYAFFYSAADPGMDGNSIDTPPYMKLFSPENEAAKQQHAQHEQAARSAFHQLAESLVDTWPETAAEVEAPLSVSDVWMNDIAPEGIAASSSSRLPVQWTRTADGPAGMGLRSVRQSQGAAIYDRFDGGEFMRIAPEQARLSVLVRPDKNQTPEAIFVELQTSAGHRRFLWGDHDAYSGARGNGGKKKKKTSDLGDVPTGGVWTKLDVTPEQLNLKAGETVRQLTLSAFNGTIDWDAVTLTGTTKAIDDPLESFVVWWKKFAEKDWQGMPGEMAPILKKGPAGDIQPEERRKLKAYYIAHIARPRHAGLQAAREAWQQAQAARAAVEFEAPGTFVFKDLGQPRSAFVMERGQYDKPGEPVEPSTPAVFPPLVKAQPDGRATRLDLAKWLVSPEHPLTARVAANRLWQLVFGTGLVKTSYDFGSQGEPPSHPELLDGLATRYRQLGWDTKALLREILTSHTFRRSARRTPDVIAADPANRWLSHGPRLRLEAEQIRDNALFVGGLLSSTMGGRGALPYQPPNIWEPVGYADSNTRYYLQDFGDRLYRRSIYAFFKRTAPPPFMTNFDAPNREQFCAVRERSNTPLQALQLMNDVQHVEAARGFATRILLDGGDNDVSRLNWAWRTAVTRAPVANELAVVQASLAAFRERYRSSPDEARELVSVGETTPVATVSHEELAAWTLVANLILNLDETIHR